MDVDDMAASGERESVAVRSSGALYMSASQKGSVSGRSRASSTIVQISPQRAAAAAAAEAEAQEDAAALSPNRRAVRPRSSSMLVGSDVASLDDASPQQGRRRRPIPAGFSKVLQDATRVAEALGKAQRARKERGDRVTSLLEEQRAAQGEATATATAAATAAVPAVPAGSTGGAGAPPVPPAVAAAQVVDPAAFQVVDAGVEVEVEEGVAAGEEEGWLAEVAAAAGGEEEEDEAGWLLRAAEVEAAGPGTLVAASQSDAQSGSRGDGYSGEVEDDEDELPFLSSAEITEACEERVAALAAGEAGRSEAARQRLFFRGITVDDAQGKWTASDGRIGHYEPPPPPSGAQGAGAGAGAASGVRQIDGEAYQRLLGYVKKKRGVVHTQPQYITKYINKLKNTKKNTHTHTQQELRPRRRRRSQDGGGVRRDEGRWRAGSLVVPRRKPAAAGGPLRLRRTPRLRGQNAQLGHGLPPRGRRVAAARGGRLVVADAVREGDGGCAPALSSAGHGRGRLRRTAARHEHVGRRRRQRVRRAARRVRRGGEPCQARAGHAEALHGRRTSVLQGSCAGADQVCVPLPPSHTTPSHTDE